MGSVLLLSMRSIPNKSTNKQENNSQQQDPGQIKIVKQNVEKEGKKIRIIQNREEIDKFLLEITPQKEDDYIMGCIFGQLIGDALGSYCEFQNYISENTLNDCMKMPGGGTFDLSSGQITDDSELAISLLNGLSEETFSQEKIAEQYLLWVQSNPFDIGQTTRQAFFGPKKNPNLSKAEAMKTSASEASQSNGCLMRISPLGIYTALLKSSKEEVFNFSQQDVELTHGNQEIHILVKIYVYTIQQLILRNNKHNIEIYNQIENLINKDFENSLAQKLLKNQIVKNESLPFNKSVGWAAIPFVESFLYLKKDQPIKFYDVMYNTIGKGGDTDTNGCIVGAFVGAIMGYKQMKQEKQVCDWMEKILACEPKLNRSNFKPIMAIQLVLRLIQQKKKN